MRRLIGYAVRNVWRSRTRGLGLTGLLAAAVMVMILIADGYAFLFDAVARSQERAQGSFWFVHEAGGALPYSAYLGLKRALLADDRIGDVRAEAPVSGLLGTEERSAPVTGIALEAIASGGVAAESTAAIDLDLGQALATTLAAAPGDMLSGFLLDRGFTLAVKNVVATEAQVLDRFYVRLRLEDIVSRGVDPAVTGIHVWLKPAAAAAGYSGKDAALASFISELSARPELAGYSAYSSALGNTRADQIVRVYDENYRVVMLVVGLTMVLALVNVLSLNVRERSQELGTLRSLGTPIRRLRLMVLVEAVAVALIAWSVGSILSLVAGMVVNAAGGLTFPPPPTSDTPIHIGLSWTTEAFLRSGATAVLGAVVAALAAAAGLGRRSVIEQLCVRD
jgi:ABC-type lipoprotein release transport system permease subunit